MTETTKIAQLFEKALAVRLFEEAVAALSDEGLVPGLVHLCSGAELVEASICLQLSGPKDQVTGSHRSHGLALLMGVPERVVAAEIAGLPSGLSTGRAGTQHLIAPEYGFLASNGIVGAQVPLAAGAALQAKVKETGGIAVTFYGDGAANQGAVFETLNLAAAKGLPLLFVMTDNGLAQTTAASEVTGGSHQLRAEGFGLPVFEMDGFDPESCLTVAEAAVGFVRAHQKPALVIAKAPRLSGHYHGGVHEGAKTTDPLQICQGMLPAAAADVCATDVQQAVAAVFADIRAELEALK